MKKLILSLGLVIASISALFAQVPLASEDVMLQGFYWNSYQNHNNYGTTKWADLNKQVDEISSSFDLLWLPPSAESGGGTGYHPKKWSNQTSIWGGATQLKELIAAFKEKGTRCIADIVINHRESNMDWDNFHNEDFGTYGKFELWPSAKFICRDDEAAKAGYSCTGNNDAGYETLTCGGGNTNNKGDITASGAYCAARDLDHSNTYLQNTIKAYLQWMKGEMGYDGWRYDLVKGYLGKYNKIYNNAANAYISVGEYWCWKDGYDQLKKWIQDTGYTSMAFDFPFKYLMNEWGGGSDYSKLVWAENKIGGLAHSAEMRQYAVTFIDNHDTASPHDNPQEYYGDKEKANAIMLANAGIPCVFWPHWVNHKTAIKKMIAARKSVGIHSNSDVTATAKGSFLEIVSKGKHGTLICFIGSGWQDPAGYTKACNGNGWAYYTKGGKPIDDITLTMNPASGYVGENGKVTLSATKGTIYYTTDGTNPSASSTKYTSAITITKNNTTIKAIAIDGTTKSSVVSGTFLTEKPEGLTVEFKAPSSWSNVYLHAWTATADIFTEGWPGKKLTKNGEYYSYTITETDERPINVIFNDGGTNQTTDITGVESNSCWDGTNPTGKDAKGYIIPGTCGDTPTPPTPPTPPGPDDPNPSLEEGYYICVNGTDFYKANALGTTDMQGREQFMASVPLKAGDKFQCYDGGSGASWSIVTLEPYGAYQSFTAASVYSDPMVCNVDGCYDLYIKLMYENDTMYIGAGTDCSAQPIKPTDIVETDAVELNIYPNPTNDYINIDCAEDINQVVIYSINGSEVIRTKSTYIDLSSLNPSMYFVNVMLQNGDVVRSKVIRK